MFVPRTVTPPAVRARHPLAAITWDTSSARPRERHGWDAVGSLAGQPKHPAAPRRLVSDSASWPSASGARGTWTAAPGAIGLRSEEHTSELQSRLHLVCRLLLEKKKQNITSHGDN